MNRKIILIVIACAVFGALGQFLSAQSSRAYRRSSIMNGNQVRTVFGNWGVIGQPAEKGKRGAWRNDNNGYLGDVSPLVGAEVKAQSANDRDTIFHSVVTCPVSRPTGLADEDPRSGLAWTFEPVGGYFNPDQQEIAMSNNKISWPSFWSDKLNDLTDPGWSGKWNGYFGKQSSADLETYFVMDDNNDKRFNESVNNIFKVAFKPDNANLQRNGLGLEMRVRALQWTQFLAKDNIFWLYEITNTGTTNYNKAVFGMLVGTYIGVTSTENYNEYSDDWSFYSAKDNIAYTGDYGSTITNALWNSSFPVGMVGYAFLESPGNPYDGIDNDGDAERSSVGVTTPIFSESSFSDSLIINRGSSLVLVHDDFTRVLYTFPSDRDSVKIYTRGMTDSVWIKVGQAFREGNRVSVVDTVNDRAVNLERPNTNAYDGIDNDFDGLIDENYFVDYHQIKKSTDGTVILIDQYRPLHYTDYRITLTQSPYSMIDEKRNDLIDNDLDWVDPRDDVGRDGVDRTSDIGEHDHLATSGYNSDGTDSGLPGEPDYDKTDVEESDQIGLTSFYYFSPANIVRMGDDEILWKNLAPGFFDVPQSIVNNRPVSGEDGDFIYGSGYFPLLAKTTERFSLALVYGGGKGGGVDADIADLLKNKRTVQKIYDLNYKFSTPPDKPTLTAVTGDHMITLYWDRIAESSVDPVLNEKDFQGYKLYKSTDPNFSDIFKITDGSGSAQGYLPLAQYDVRDSVEGFFMPGAELYEAASGYAYYLGNNSGLQHSYVDNEVRNGQRYFYALVAYDRGDLASGIFPSENSKFISVSASGEISHDINIVVVAPNAPAAGYVAAPPGTQLTHVEKYGTGSIAYEIVDPPKITGHTYEVTFLDTQNDGVDNNANNKIDIEDSTESQRITSFYSVTDLNDITEMFISQDTIKVSLRHKNIFTSTIEVKDAQGAIVDPSKYTLDTLSGTINGRSFNSLPQGSYSIKFRYMPVVNSPNIKDSPYLVESKDAEVFDGVRLNFDNQWWCGYADTLTRWSSGDDPYLINFAPISAQYTVPPPAVILQGIRKPCDYRVEFYDTLVDTSLAFPKGFISATPVNFKIYNETENTYIKFIFFDNDGNGVISSKAIDEIYFVEQEPTGRWIYSWDINVISRIKPNGVPDDSTYIFGAGDTLFLRTTKPFRKGDVLRFATTSPKVDEIKMKADLKNVKVVPNPYVTASAFEPPLNPGITSGRGIRKIDFIHIPPHSVISIFTARGEHVISLQHDGNIEDGTVSWNLKSKENLDVAFGVYFYVVDSSIGTKTGKFAIIK